MRIDISSSEHDLLCKLLRYRISEYYMEIRHAGISEFKQRLKRKKLHLAAILQTLEYDPANLTLTSRQADHLLESLREASREIASELWHTDNSRWRSQLKIEKSHLMRLLEKVERVSGEESSVNQRRQS